MIYTFVGVGDLLIHELLVYIVIHQDSCQTPYSITLLGQSQLISDIPSKNTLEYLHVIL